MWKGTNYGVLNTTFRNPDGTFAYDKIQEMNAASPDGSRMIMSKSNNNHMWYGLLSTYTNQISKSLELSAGIDVRYYIGEHNNEIIDLYDGKYFIDDSSRANVKPEQNAAAADPNWVYENCRSATRFTATTTATYTRKAYSPSWSGRRKTSTPSYRVRFPTPATGATTASTTTPHTPSPST